MARMLRFTIGTTDLNVTDTDSVTAYSSCAATEACIIIGDNIHGKYKSLKTLHTSIEKLSERVVKKLKTAPGSGKYAAWLMAPGDSPSLAALTTPAAADSVDDDKFGIVWGNTFHPKSERSGAFLTAVEQVLEYYWRVHQKKV